LEAPLIFRPAPVRDAYVIELERKSDERGYFARTWCREEFARAGIACDMVQASVSHNRSAGTVRGLHFAWPPAREAKLVRCERGAVFDVIVDLRPDSATYRQHFSLLLDAEQRNALYIPPGFAHGFQTLTDNADVLYMMTETYRPELADGLRHDDPAFAIAWPRPATVLIERDRRYPDFDPERHAADYQRRCH
jgi:dTDP-4-dehydrorhamnose 3,5-epimerase